MTTSINGSMDELRGILRGGVCDYSKPGVMRQKPAGTYLVLPLHETPGGASGSGARVE
jgi:hypothetical protein